MKKKIVLSLLTVLSLFMVIGCGKKDAIKGTWEGKSNDGIEVTFTFKDGNFTYKNAYATVEGEYSIKDNNVTMNSEDWSKEKIYNYEIKDKKLTLTATDKISPSYTDLEKK